MPVDRPNLVRTAVDRFLALMPPTPFGRLVRAHLVTMCADACIAASLAGSLFFAKPGSGARGSILLYLLLLPPLLAKTILRPFFVRMGFVRFFLLVTLIQFMALLPIKMILRWTINLKYIVFIPEAFFNI